MRLQPRRRDSSGTAAVEFAAVAPLLLLLLLGLWEVGRAIQVQQILSNAAREGARAAAQAQIVNAVGAYTRIGVTTGAPNVTGTVRAYLVGEGITNHTGLDVKFEFLIPDGSGGMMVDTSRSQPYEGHKGDVFRVTVTLPAANFRWTLLGPFIPDNLTSSVVWQMLVDDPFTLDTSIPGWSP